MDLKQHLRGRNLKWNWDSISDYVVKHPNSIQQIIHYCVDDETIVCQNAGAVLGKIVDLDKKILIPYYDQMVANLRLNPHDAVKRASMRVWQFAEITEEFEGEIFDIAMSYVSDKNAAIAIRAFGITAARKICQKYPELAHELIPFVETMVDQKISAGIISRGKKELKLLRDLI